MSNKIQTGLYIGMQLNISLYTFNAYNDGHVRIFYLYFDFTWHDKSEWEKKTGKRKRLQAKKLHIT